MERDPGDFKSGSVGEGSISDEDARLDALIASLPPAPGIKHIDDDEDEDEEAQIDADIAAGRVYPHEVVGQWLKTWGEPDRKPFQEWLAARDG